MRPIEIGAEESIIAVSRNEAETTMAALKIFIDDTNRYLGTERTPEETELIQSFLSLVTGMKELKNQQPSYVIGSSVDEEQEGEDNHIESHTYTPGTYRTYGLRAGLKGSA